MFELGVLRGKESDLPLYTTGFEMALVISLISRICRLNIEPIPLESDVTASVLSHSHEFLKLQDDTQSTGTLTAVPLGVCVGLMSQDSPMLTGLKSLIPALLGGNTFIWKPSSATPYSALKLAEIGSKVFPEGVFQAICGDANIGSSLANDDRIAYSAFSIQGQIHSNITRVFVHNSQFDQFTGRSAKFQAHDSLRPSLEVSEWLTLEDLIKMAKAPGPVQSASIWSHDNAEIDTIAFRTGVVSFGKNVCPDWKVEGPTGFYQDKQSGAHTMETVLLGWCKPQVTMTAQQTDHTHSTHASDASMSYI
ncbi:Aldehyde/histidinol dehydrogenase [Astrocystis sublimbata]|nr:Aldehyde/histidinol dehydrogenase [Astrocystis sublimbata]